MLNTSRRGFLKGIAALGVATAVPVALLREAEAAAHVVPEGWLLCFGQEISRSTYADLFAVMGTVYGAGDGATTFNVPDTRRKAALPSNELPLVHIIKAAGDPRIPVGTMAHYLLRAA